MATYTITTRSILYTVYEIEADTETEARAIVDTADGLGELHSWTEDTHIDTVDLDEETED
jgi:hypothetical protein